MTLICIRSDLKSFEWIKLLWRHLHQIKENWAGRNFIFLSCEFTAHYASRNAEMNYQRIQQPNNFPITNLLIECWGVRLTWLNCKWLKWIKMTKKTFHFKKTHASPLRCCLSFIYSSGFPLESQSISNYGSVFFFRFFPLLIRLIYDWLSSIIITMLFVFLLC